MSGEAACPLCGETVDYREASRPMGTLEGMRNAHLECLQREVMGGIGHLIAHDYWCTQHHDPDAGLTRRQSARLVQAFFYILGTDAQPLGGDVDRS